jgi:hypothetical protein
MRIKQKQNDYILKIYVEPKNSTPDKPNSLKNKKKSLRNPTNQFQPTRNHKKPFWLGQNFAFRPNLELLPITPQPTLLIS